MWRMSKNLKRLQRNALMFRATEAFIHEVTP
jgi:hypothetical protein